jgi:glycosyltransferase involved in cell wall biosynthesis
MDANRTSGYPAALVSETPPSSAAGWPKQVAASTRPRAARAESSTTERGAEAFRRWQRRAVDRRSRRPRIALVTPWPPDWSGVAEYNRRLTTALASRVDIDVVTAQPSRPYSIAPGRGVRLVAAGARDLLADSRRYDRLVYCMGNSRFHAHVFELLAERPDAVVFHDVQLTGFFGAIAGSDRPEDPGGALASRIEAMYPDLAAAVVASDDAPWPTPALCMTRGIQRQAKQCFVHSRSALEMLTLDRGALDRHAPATILPYGLPEVAEGVRARGPASSAPLIVSLGAVAEVKGIAKVISAFALLAQEYPTARLVIAGGPAEHADAWRWHDYARKHAPRASIEIPGRVSDARYAALLRDADVAVQLRLVSNGEASGATADCLAAGIPTLVTDLGWAGELPADVVARVPVDADAALVSGCLDELLVDPQKRAALSAASLDHARSHSVARAADAYIQALELA